MQQNKERVDSMSLYFMSIRLNCVNCERTSCSVESGSLSYLIFQYAFSNSILGLGLREANDALEGLGLDVILGGGRPLEGGPFALDDIVGREVVGQGGGIDYGVGAVVGFVADDGQLDRVFDDIAAFDRCKDQTGIHSDNLEVDVLADILVVVDLHRLLQSANFFSFC